MLNFYQRYIKHIEKRLRKTVRIATCAALFTCILNVHVQLLNKV